MFTWDREGLIFFNRKRGGGSCNVSNHAERTRTVVVTVKDCTVKYVFKYELNLIYPLKIPGSTRDTSDLNIAQVSIEANVVFSGAS